MEERHEEGMPLLLAYRRACNTRRRGDIPENKYYGKTGDITFEELVCAMPPTLKQSSAKVMVSRMLANQKSSHYLRLSSTKGKRPKTYKLIEGVCPTCYAFREAVTALGFVDENMFRLTGLRNRKQGASVYFQFRDGVEGEWSLTARAKRSIHSILQRVERFEKREGSDASMWMLGNIVAEVLSHRDDGLILAHTFVEPKKPKIVHTEMEFGGPTGPLASTSRPGSR